MTNDERQAATRPKRSYVKPRITQVVLRPEEAVLGACKKGSKSGPGQPRCWFPSTCSSQGS